MKRNLGRMRHKFDIQDPTRVDDGALGFNRSDTVIASVWGNLTVASANEVYQYGRLQQVVSHAIIIRFDKRVRQGMNLVHSYQGNERLFYIQSVINVDERGEFMKLMCREGGNA